MKKEIVILGRIDDQVESEFVVAKSMMNVQTDRDNLPNGSVVVGRYGVLPFYGHLDVALRSKRSFLINSVLQHEYLQNIGLWIKDLREYTPKTWFDWAWLPREEKAYVVKGYTNSRKHEWNTSMFAPDRMAALEVSSKLRKDPLLKDQGLCYREYIPLKRIATAENGLPISNEWRFFYLFGQLVGCGFYWNEYAEGELAGEITAEGMELANKIAEIVNFKANFFVVDIAETAEGDWILIEIQDAQMAGLSAIEPRNFYGNLSNILEDFYQ